MTKNRPWIEPLEVQLSFDRFKNLDSKIFDQVETVDDVAIAANENGAAVVSDSVEFDEMKDIMVVKIAGTYEDYVKLMISKYEMNKWTLQATHYKLP